MRQLLPLLTLALFASAALAQQPFEGGCTLPYQAIESEHPVIDGSCGKDGSARDGSPVTDAAKLAENRAKNSFCQTRTPVSLTYKSFLRLQMATNDIKQSQLTDRPALLAEVVTVGGKKIGEGTPVRYVAYIVHAAYSDYQRGKSAKYGESVNCYRPSTEENDIHIMLGQSGDDEPCSTLTGEMSPHYRPLSWTPENLNAIRKHPVRITAPLFFDSSHKPCHDGVRPKPNRASVWELHPVYAIEVCKGTDLKACRRGPKANWIPLDEWFSHNSDEE